MNKKNIVITLLFIALLIAPFHFWRQAQGHKESAALLEKRVHASHELLQQARDQLNVMRGYVHDAAARIALQEQTKAEQHARQAVAIANELIDQIDEHLQKN